jgi:CxxC motif-containing protein (DUF1111 family)
LGLLEALPPEAILALADPQDKDGDDVSGRPNWVWDKSSGTVQLGRFGRKANQPNLLQQVAGAYFDDMGVTNPLFPEADSSLDINGATLRATVFYTQTLAVPVRANVGDPQVVRGEALFEQARCSTCHVPTLKTGDYPVTALRHQTIHPYTDLLLHDMGLGLSDGRSDFEASGREWRTPPLWGLGLTEKVLGAATYLHDGRARTVEEAILWHGGEAEASKEAFRKIPAEDRQALVRFLFSL